MFKMQSDKAQEILLWRYMGDLWWRLLKHCGGVESSNEFEVAQMFENSSFSIYVMKRKVIIRFCFTLLTISTIRFKSLSSYVKCLARWRWLDYFRGVFCGFWSSKLMCSLFMAFYVTGSQTLHWESILESWIQEKSKSGIIIWLIM